MRFIALNRYYWPDHSATAQMLTDLAQYLAANGHEMTVIASQLRYEGGARLARREQACGVRIHRVWTTSFGRHGLIGRAIDYFTFMIAAAGELARIATQSDIVIVKTDPPMLLGPVAAVAFLKKFKQVNWCQDLFPETASALGLRWARGPLGSVLRWIRNGALKSAAFNAVLNQKMRAVLLAEGIEPARLRVLENWADADIWPVPRQQNQLRKAWGLGDTFTIGYSGNLGRAHMPDCIAELLRRTLPERDVSWLFIGGGPGLGVVRAAAGEAANIQFLPYQPRESLASSLSAPDAHLISLAPECEGYIAPSKYYGVVAANRPIIFLGDPEGDIAQHIKARQFGCVLDCRTPELWRAQINALRAAVIDRDGKPPAYVSPTSTREALEAWRMALENLGADRREQAPFAQHAQALGAPHASSGLAPRSRSKI